MSAASAAHNGDSTGDEVASSSGGGSGADGAVVYGTLVCSVAMVSLQRVRVHLTDLKLSDYPERYKYDVKLVYLDVGHTPFSTGYITATEKWSEAVPRFSAQPTLEVETSLRDMLVSATTSGDPSLKLFFSVHRQVARERPSRLG